MLNYSSFVALRIGTVKYIKYSCFICVVMSHSLFMTATLLTNHCRLKTYFGITDKSATKDKTAYKRSDLRMDKSVLRSDRSEFLS